MASAFGVCPNPSSQAEMIATEEPSADAWLPWADLDAQAEEIRTPCGDGEMLWRSWGSAGTPLVLLHGGAGSWLHWLRTIPNFMADRRVIAADLPGLGSSAMPPLGSDGDAIAEIVGQGLRSIIGPALRADLVGFSFGGVVAGLIAAKPLTATRLLVLVGSGGLGVIRKTALLERVRDKTGAARDAAHRTNLNRWMIANIGQIDPLAIRIQDWNSRHARLDSRPIGVSDLLAPALPSVRARVAGIWGALDHAVQGDTDRVETVLRRLCPRLEFRVVPDAGHWVAYEEPENFVAALRDITSAVGPS
jgi:2-hydroxy-6-oxonona-2,4-dienedioate hydrolase